MKLTDVLLSRRRTEAAKDESADRWSEEVQAVPVHLVRPSKYQPRQEFSEQALLELAESIKLHGLLQPILVRRGPIGYELIVGERRLRACKSLGWEVIPAIIKDVEDKEAAELTLIENLQRADLHFFEIAEGYELLLTEFELTQEELAGRLGVSQANVANKIRLLRLPAEIRRIISREMLSERHGRALLRLKDKEEQFKVVEQVVREELSVRQTEELVRGLGGAQGAAAAEAPKLRGRRRLVLKDLRIFSNSLRQLTKTLQSSGLEVELQEHEDEQSYEAVVKVSKVAGGELNG